MFIFAVKALFSVVCVFASFLRTAVWCLVQNSLFNSVCILWASTDLDYVGQAVGAISFFFFFFSFLFQVFKNKSPSTSLVKENAVTLFGCEAPEMFS